MPSLRVSAHVREFVFGLEDGLVSTLGAVIGIAAGSSDRRVVILSGLVLVAVEALSMAAGSYLSNKSQAEMARRQIEEVRERIVADPETEKKRLAKQYRARGFTVKETAILMKRVTAKPALWVEELSGKVMGVTHGDADTEGVPRMGAVLMGSMYIVGGMIPVAPFFFLPLGQASIVGFICTVCALFVIGAQKARLTVGNVWRSGLEMVAVSMTAAVLGFLIGRLVGDAFGLHILT